MLWPSSSREAILAAFPERSYQAIREKARRLRIHRKREPHREGASRHWTDEEKAKLVPLYEAGAPIAEIAVELDRGQAAIMVKASKLKLRRPREVKWRRLEPIWSEPIDSLKGSKEECSMVRSIG